MGGRYPDLVPAVEDPAQGPMTMANCARIRARYQGNCFLILVMLTEEAALRNVQAVHDSNEAGALRLLYRRYNPLTQGRMLARLNEVLQVDLGTDERASVDHVVQWEQRIHEFVTMSRENAAGRHQESHHHREIYLKQKSLVT